jgi:hypothetical protein
MSFHTKNIKAITWQNQSDGFSQNKV